MDRHDDDELELETEPVTDEQRRSVQDTDDYDDEGETHATTGGAAAAGAVTGGVIGLTGGPIGAAIGAVGGAIVGAAAERMMHSDDESDELPLESESTDFEDRTSGPTTAEMREEPTMREREREAREEERRIEEDGRPLV